MHRFNLPYCMVVEEHIFDSMDRILTNELEIRADLKKCLIVTEENLSRIFASQLEEMQRDLPGAEIYFIENESFDTAMELTRYIYVEEVDVVIGFGGGRVLDTAKYAAFVAKRTFICLPTTLSNDSIASPFSVLATQTGRRSTLGCRIPAAIVVDTEVIRNAPLYQLQSGIGDTISKYSALYDWKLDAARTGNKIDDFAYMISDMAFNEICYNEEKSLQSMDFIRVLTQSLVAGGLAMEIAGNSRPSSGSEHLFAHALEEHFPDIRISHGMAVAMGTVVAASLQNRDVQKIENVIKAYGLDVRPSTYGLSKEDFMEAWRIAPTTRKGRVTILSEVEFSKELYGSFYEKLEAMSSQTE